MYGALLGDMIGAPYEFDRGNKTKYFPLFGKDSGFTDDSVMTIAIAEALVNARADGVENNKTAVEKMLINSMRRWGKKYPNAGYGGRFRQWLKDFQMGPYGSYGNGSAMRVSAVGWLYDDLETTRRVARWTAEVTHNHPEGIKGAEATASVIFMARKRFAKEEIKEYLVREFGYDLSRTCDEIRPNYRHVESCQETVPEAITAFLEGKDFEDVIRTAVSLGGDCDTLTCIAGSMAEAYYGVPSKLVKECRARLPEDMLNVIDRLHAGKKYEVNFRYVVKLTEQDIEDIMVTALEGGIGYWAILDNSRPEFENWPEEMSCAEIATRILISGGKISLIEEENEEVHDLSLNDILTGIQTFVNEGCDRYGAFNPQEIDLGNFDAECADLVIQFAIFGEQVYG